MKILTLRKLLGLLSVFFLLAQYAYAQEKQQGRSDDTPRKVIVKKIDVADSPTEIKVIVNTDEVSDIDAERNVQVEVEEIDGEKHILVEMQPIDGDPEIIEWTGKGELPEDIRQQLEAKGVFLHDLHSGNDNGVFIYKDDTQKGDFNWVTNDDVPGAFLGVISEQEAKTTVIIDENGEEKITESRPSEVDGLTVGAVVSGSAAEVAGLRKGDILQKINGNTLEDFSDLVSFMQEAEVGQTVSIVYEREGKPMKTEATLQERQRGHGNVIIERTMEEDMNGDHNVFIFRNEEGEDDVQVHTRHRVVVITRSDKEEPLKEEMEFTPEALPDTELQRTLPLRDFALFPNPTEGDLRLRFSSETSPVKIEINDLSGKNMYRERLNKFDGQYDENIDLSDLPSGVFLLTIEQNDKVHTEQIVVK